MLIKNPKKYISGAGVIREAGTHIKEFCKKPLIIGGKRALDAALDPLLKSMKENGTDPVRTEVFSGYPSKRQFEYYEGLIRESMADGVIVLGGGRAIDTAKAAAERAGRGVIAIPTVAATCASWAALVIEYDDRGAYTGRIVLKDSPLLVIADTEILLSTPERYLFSGVVDTFAKYYETRHVFLTDQRAMHMDLSLHASEIAFDRLEENTFRALFEGKKGVFGQAAKDVVDSVIYLAGFAGAFQEKTGGYCFAHPFYHTSTRYMGQDRKMHGEIVSFGIMTQLFLEGRNPDEIRETLEIFKKYDNVFTLKDLGLDRDDRDMLLALSEEIKREFDHVSFEAASITEAMLEADLLAESIK